MSVSQEITVAVIRTTFLCVREKMRELISRLVMLAVAGMR